MKKKHLTKPKESGRISKKKSVKKKHIEKSKRIFKNLELMI